MAPAAVAWSMLAGAAAWALLRILLLGPMEGAWYPIGLGPLDPRGLYGYQLALGLGLIAADAAYSLARAAAGTAGASDLSGQAARAKAPRKAAAAGCNDNVSGGGGGGGVFSAAAIERAARRQAFVADGAATPQWALGCWVTAAALLAAGVVTAPRLLAAAAPGLRATQLLPAAAAAPLVALAAARAAGAADASLAAPLATAACVLWAAWAGPGAGAAGGGAGLAAAGFALGPAVAAALMAQNFATARTSMASPRAVFAAHVLGAVAGAFTSPLALGLAAPGTTGASPLAGAARAAADAFATRGAAALPDGTPWFALAGAAAGLVLAAARDVAGCPGHAYVRSALPTPLVAGLLMLDGANVAVGACLGAAARAFWRWRAPRRADTYGALVGAALVAGDGGWAAAAGLLAGFRVAAPICMSFARAPGAPSA
jgi:hypothetical protein